MTSNLFTFSIAAELSPPTEHFESLDNQEAKKEDEITSMAEAIMDEAGVHEHADLDDPGNSADGFIDLFLREFSVFCQNFSSGYDGIFLI